jgi:hypothetical protein
MLVKLLAAVLTVLALVPLDRPCTCGGSALTYADPDHPDRPLPHHHDDDCAAVRQAPAFDAPPAPAVADAPPVARVSPAAAPAVVAQSHTSPLPLRPPRVPRFLSLLVLRN